MSVLKDLSNDTLINNIARGLTSAGRLELLEEVRRRLNNPIKPLKPPPLPELNAELIEILGRPNFQCAQLAALLRTDGKEINFRAEDEQATVLHWMLGFYIGDKERWRDHLDIDYRRMMAKVQAKP